MVEGAIAKIMKPNDVARTLFSKERLDRNGLKQLIPDFDWDDFFLQFGYPDVGVAAVGSRAALVRCNALHSIACNTCQLDRFDCQSVLEMSTLA